MSRRHVLVTGAAGHIGTSFWRAQQSSYHLRLADKDISGLQESQCEVVPLDITKADACMQACDGIDTVLHLAANASPDADYYSLLETNLTGTYNIFAAAKAQNCKRVVFASSAQAVEGYAPDLQVHEGMPPRPKNLYGASKAFGEAVASLFSDDGTMTTVAVRIANFTHFQAGQTHSARDMAAFISEADIVHLLVRCIEAELFGFTLVHGVSDNRYKRLAIQQTRKAVGYNPTDDAFAILGIESHA